jgi:hypothetical protein
VERTKQLQPVKSEISAIEPGPKEARYRSVEDSGLPLESHIVAINLSTQDTKKANGDEASDLYCPQRVVQGCLRHE